MTAIKNRPTTLEELDWIHDCVVFELNFRVSAEGSRSLRVAMQCPDDLGYPVWAGKNVLLVAVEVVATKSFLWGWVAGRETVDAIRPRVSDGFLAMIKRWPGHRGLQFPKLDFTISLSSGSQIEVVCEELQISYY